MMFLNEAMFHKQTGLPFPLDSSDAQSRPIVDDEEIRALIFNFLRQCRRKEGSADV
ncbi:MAG: hypothetical protein R3F23_05155 [Verrucomicrobiia bacterium]